MEDAESLSAGSVLNRYLMSGALRVRGIEELELDLIFFFIAVLAFHDTTASSVGLPLSLLTIALDSMCSRIIAGAKERSTTD